MRDVSFDTGQIIFREGDAADAVYLLRSGAVEVVRESQATEIRLAVLGEGELFGEISVIRGEARSTTLRALGPASAVEIPREAFLKAFPDDNPLALKVLRGLCGRLINSNDMMVDGQVRRGVGEEDLRRVRLLPDSPEVGAQIGEDGVAITAFPFEVGGHIRAGVSPSHRTHGLSLRHADEQRISNPQFSLEFVAGRLHLRDLGSRLGTVVNDVRLARFEETDIIPLDLGESRVQTGGEDSPYRFRLLVEG